MKPEKIPGAVPHRPPPAASQHRMLAFTPYVREAIETMRPTWHIRSRKLFDYLLLHWIDGGGELTIGDRVFTAQDGDLFWISPNTLHEMRGDAPGTLLRYIHFDLHYDPDRSHWSARIPGGTTDLSAWPERMHPPVDDPVIGSWCGKIEPGNPALISELLRRIILEYNRTETSNLVVSGLVKQLLGHLLEGHGSESQLGIRHARVIENAMQHIQLHSHEKLNAETLVRQHGISPTHFRKLFKEHYRQSPRAAHLNAKMRTACDFLIYSNLSVSEIADRLGFTNVHNFSRAFHNAIGCAPTAYRAGCDTVFLSGRVIPHSTPSPRGIGSQADSKKGKSK